MLLPYEFPRVCTAFVPVVVWADTKVTKDKISETFDWRFELLYSFWSLYLFSRNCKFTVNMVLDQDDLCQSNILFCDALFDKPTCTTSHFELNRKIKHQNTTSSL